MVWDLDTYDYSGQFNTALQRPVFERKQQESNHTKKTQVHNIGDSQSFTACGRNTDAPDG